MKAPEVTLLHPHRLERLVMFNLECLSHWLAGGSVFGSW